MSWFVAGAILGGLLTWYFADRARMQAELKRDRQQLENARAWQERGWKRYRG